MTRANGLVPVVCLLALPCLAVEREADWEPNGNPGGTYVQTTQPRHPHFTP